MGKLRILFLTPASARSGAPMLMLHLLRYLRVNSEHELGVVAVGGGVMAKDLEAVASLMEFHEPASTTLGARALRRLPAFSRARRATLVKRCRAVVKQWPPDLVFCNSASAAGVLEALGPYSCPVLVYLHELEHVLHSITWIPGGALPLLKKNATRFVAGSNAVRLNMINRHGVSPDRIQVVHDFIDVAEFAAGVTGDRSPAALDRLRTMGIPDNACVVGAIATVEWRKGADLFVSLARQLPAADAAGRPIHLIWVGGGYPADTAQFSFDVQTASVGDRVHLAGPTQRTADWYPVFDVLALTSREDPFPLVALEAAASGLPIVCFERGGGMPEFVETDAGRVVPFLDLSAFASALLELLNDPALRDKLGRTAARKVRERHDVTVAVPLLLQVIEQAVASRP